MPLGLGDVTLAAVVTTTSVVFVDVAAGGTTGGATGVGPIGKGAGAAMGSALRDTAVAIEELSGVFDPPVFSK